MIEQQGLELLATGMGMVFTFLTVMVAVLYASAAFFKRFQHVFPDEAQAPHRQEPAAPQAVQPEIAVILAALAAGRRGNKEG